MVMKETKTSFPGTYMKPTAYDSTTTSAQGTQPCKTVAAMGKIDTSDLIM